MRGIDAPAGDYCIRAHDGSFIGGRLRVPCGNTTTYYDAQGTQTGTTVTTYDSVTVTKL